MYPLLLSDFNEPGIFSTGFRKKNQISNFMKIRPVEAELFHAEGQNGHEEGNSCFLEILRKRSIINELN